jgi:dipeptidyl aminopeptidase/acylaminoacyl peptidase
MQKNSIRLISLLVLTALLAACAAQAPIASSPTPAAPTQTSTVTLTAAPSETPLPSATPLPTDTPTPAPTPTLTPAPSTVCQDGAASPFYARFTPVDSAGLITVSADGVTLVDPDNGALHPIHPLTQINRTGWDTGLSWSPDGSMLAFLHAPAGQDPAMPFFLLVADLSAGEVCPLLQLPGWYSLPAWSPDGANLAVTDGSRDILVVVEIESQNATNLAVDAYGGIPPQWVDTLQVAYITLGMRNTGDLVLAQLGRARPVVLLKNVPGLRDFQFSDDGAWLAYFAGGLHVKNMANGQLSTVGDMTASLWLPGQQYLMVQPGAGGLALLDTQQRFAARMLPFSGLFGRQSFAPDGRFAVFDYTPPGEQDSQITIWDSSSDELRPLEIPGEPAFEPAWSPKAR